MCLYFLQRNYGHVCNDSFQLGTLLRGVLFILSQMLGAWAGAPVQAVGYLFGSVCADGCCFLLVVPLAGDAAVGTGETALSPCHLGEWWGSMSSSDSRGDLRDHTGPSRTSPGTPGRIFQPLERKSVVLSLAPWRPEPCGSLSSCPNWTAVRWPLSSSVQSVQSSPRWGLQTRKMRPVASTFQMPVASPPPPVMKMNMSSDIVKYPQG